jgi:hypothetical protein
VVPGLAEDLFDRVRVYQCTDITCASYTKIVELTGQYSSTKSVTATTGFMVVLFTSDYENTATGFTASWTSVSPVSQFFPLMYVYFLLTGWQDVMYDGSLF